MNKIVWCAALILLLQAGVAHPQITKPALAQIDFLRDGESVNVTSVGDITVELKFDRPMNRNFDPVVNFGLEPPYPLNVPKGQGWISNILWQGFFTVSNENPETADGEYIFKIYGAVDTIGIEMDSTLSSDLDKSLFICRFGELQIEENTLEFGNLNAGTSKSLSLMLRNVSCADIDTVRLSQLSAPFFVVNQLSTFSIFGESSVSVTLRFDPLTRGSFTDTLVIESSDRHHSTFEIALNGSAHGPKIELDPDTALNFGHVEAGSDSSQVVVVTNRVAKDSALSDTLRVSSIRATNATIYKVSPRKLTIPPGASKNVTVTFKPKENRSYNGHRLDFQTNDLTQPAGIRSIGLNGDATDRQPPPSPSTLTIDWGYTGGYTNGQSLHICWENPDDPSGIAEIRWKFTQKNVAPQNANDTTAAGGRYLLQDNTTCADLPLFGRLTKSGRWYCFVWFVDGNNNSGWANNPLRTSFVYDVNPPGQPVILGRSIPSGQWFGSAAAFSLTIGIPVDSERGVRDASELRWKFQAAPTTAADTSGSKLIQSNGQEQVTLTLPFADPALCGEDSLYVWLADSAGNSSAQAIAIVPYRFDICAPEITRPAPDSRNVALLGQAYLDTVSITDESGIDTLWVHYRFGGAESEEPPRSAARLGNTNKFMVDIPAAGVTRRGVEYKVTARDLAGNESNGPGAIAGCEEANPWFPVRTRVEGQGDFRIDSDGRALPLVSSSDETNYQLFSIPYDLDANALDAVLTDDFGPYDITSWRFFDYKPNNPTGPVWLEGKDARPFVPGRSYFIATRRENVIVDSGPGQTRRTVCPDTLRLYQGWNLIATPFNFPVHKESLRIKYGDIDTLKVTLRSFERGWNITDVMQPWRGYALYVPKIAEAGEDVPIYLIVQPKAAAGRLNKATLVDAELRPGEWLVQISAKAGVLHDRENWAGVRQAATPGFDPGELAEPPVIGKFVRVAFPHPEWQQPAQYFSTDLHPTGDPDQLWQFEVTTNLPETSVELHFDLLGDFPSDSQVYLLDETLGLAQNLHLKPEYSFKSGKQETERQFKLVVGSQQFAEESSDNIALVPKEFELLQNFPNPFNPSTTIRYNLPEANRVKLSIYDLLGRPVCVLVNDEQQNAGYYTVVWDGRDAQGRQVASGIYVYKIDTGQRTLARTMILLK